MLRMKKDKLDLFQINKSFNFLKNIIELYNER